MGNVYVCYDHEERSVHALKTFQERFFASKEMQDAFKREALAWVHLEHHPNIVRAQWVNEYDYRLFVVADFIAPDDQGRNTLSHYLRGDIPLKQALTWAIDCCRGMEYAASRKVTPHRDLKPDNLMITSDGVLMITDFGLAGIAAALDSVDLPGEERKGLSYLRLRHGKTIAGTPPYMAPEQFEGFADEHSDIYSFGIILYQMVSKGKLPFSATPSMTWKEVHATVSLPYLDSPLLPIIERCTRKAPDDRYQTFGSLRVDLEELYRKTEGIEPPAVLKQKELDAWERLNQGLSLTNLGLLDEAIAEC
jgi:serine/threonine protein kinase